MSDRHTEVTIFFRSFSYCTCFLTGLAILIVELTAFRLLAPHFGASSYVVGAIINTILLALSAGYLLGGFLVDRYPLPRLPYWAVLLAAAYLTGVYAGYPQLLAMLADHSLIYGSVLATFALFFTPTLLLAAVPPFLIKLMIVAGKVGAASGMVFSVSTLGSICGGVLTTYLLIPYLGSRMSLALTVSGLFLLAALGLSLSRRAYAPLLLAAGLPLLIQPAAPYVNVVHRQESAYNSITVIRSDQRRLLVLNDNLGVQSVSLHPKTRLAEGFVSDAFLYPQLLIDADRTLILGNAAGSTMTSTAHYFDTEIVGIEVDPAITAAGQNYFDLDLDNPRLKVVHQDGRVYLNRRLERFDVIAIDVYGVGHTVPFHVVTVEFFRRVSEALNEGGIVAINLPYFAADSELERRYMTTIGRVFSYALRYGHMLYLFNRPTDRRQVLERLNRRQWPPPLFLLASQISRDLQTVHLPRSGPVFSDDYAPIEKLTAGALSDQWLKEQRALRRVHFGY